MNTATWRGPPRSRRRGPAVLSVAGHLASLLCVCPVRAQAVPETRAVHQTLEVIVATHATSPSMLEAALDPVLGQVDIAVRWSLTDWLDVEDLFVARPADPPLIARVWIDLNETRHVGVYLSDRDSQRYLVRDIPLRHGLDDLACETVVTVIESAVEALREGSAIGVSRTEARALVTLTPRPRSPPPPPVPRRSSPQRTIRAAAGVHYEGVAIGAPVPVAQGPGVSLILASQRRTLRPAAWLSASGHLPVTYPGGPIGVTLTTGTLRLLPALETSFGSRVTARLGIGAGADVTYVEPMASSASATLQPRHFGAVAVARAALGVDVLLGASVWLSMGVACDVDVTANHYDILVGGTKRTEVVAPWVAQPVMLLGVTWEFVLLLPQE